MKCTLLVPAAAVMLLLGGCPLPAVHAAANYYLTFHVIGQGTTGHFHYQQIEINSFAYGASAPSAADNGAGDIYGIHNATFEQQGGIVNPLSNTGSLPTGWTFNNDDFSVTTTTNPLTVGSSQPDAFDFLTDFPLANDPLGTMSLGNQPIDLLDKNGNVLATVIPAAVPEVSTPISFGLLMALGLVNAVVAAKRKKAV